MSVDLKARAAQAVELAQKAGAEDAWSTASQSRDVQFEFRDGNLEKVKDTTSQSLAIRIYAGGRYSSHATTDLNPERLQDFITEAVAITAALEPDEYRRITPEKLFRDRPGDDLDLVDPGVQALEREQRIAWCRALDEVAHQHADVISATSGVYDGMQRSASVSSNGFLDEQRSTRRGGQQGAGENRVAAGFRKRTHAEGADGGRCKGCRFTARAPARPGERPQYPAGPLFLGTANR